MSHYPEKTETDEILSSFNTLCKDLEHRINWGNDANKPISPNVGDRYIALDTNKLYLCFSIGVWTEFSGGNGGNGDMLKSVYDINNNGIVDNSEKLEGSTKTEVQNHTPKAHTLDSHSEKKLDTLDEKTLDAGVIVDSCLIKDGKVADSNKLEGNTKSQVQDHSAKAHNLGGTEHIADTLANLNSKIEDAILTESYMVLTFFIPTADLTVGTNKTYEIYVPFNLIIKSIFIHTKTAPGENKEIIVDVNKNGITLFTNQDFRPLINDSAKSSGTEPSITTVVGEDIISVDIDEATAGHSATDMTIQVRCRIA